MSNFSLEQLLQWSPLEALLIAYNDKFGTQLNPRYVELVHVIPDDAGRAIVKLKARGVLPNADDQRFFNSGSFSIQRLDLGELFDSVFAIEQFDRIMSRDVARIITQRTGVVFDENDFIEDILTPENNILQVSPYSLRWHGQLTIVQA